LNYHPELAANRHDRRRRARVSDFRLGSIEIVGDSWLVDRAESDPAFAHRMASWVDRIETLRPMCLHCDHEFSHGDPPRVWGVIRPDLRRDEFTLCGICGGCISSDPMGDAITALSRAGLTVRPVNHAAISPAGGRA
jgi:hypothetical protein